MSLTHDIKLVRTESNTVSCLMLDIKEAFNHVSTNLTAEDYDKTTAIKTSSELN